MSRRDRPRRARRWRVRGIFMIAVWLIVGCVLLGTGLSNVQHARQLSAHGVTVAATVLQDQGYGRYAVRVGYQTAAGQREQGTLDTPQEAASYPVGSPVVVTYDPSSPSVVALPGSGSADGAWAEVAVGAFALLLLAGGALLSWLRRAPRAAS